MQPTKLCRDCAIILLQTIMLRKIITTFICNLALAQSKNQDYNFYITHVTLFWSTTKEYIKIRVNNVLVKLDNLKENMLSSIARSPNRALC